MKTGVAIYTLLGCPYPGFLETHLGFKSNEYSILAVL